MAKRYDSVPEMIRDLSVDKAIGEQHARRVEKNAAKTSWWKCQGCGSVFPMFSSRIPRQCKVCRVKHCQFSVQELEKANDSSRTD